MISQDTDTAIGEKFGDIKRPREKNGWIPLMNNIGPSVAGTDPHGLDKFCLWQ